MEGNVKKFFLDHWQRKLISLVAAICLWLVIERSITTTRTFTHVPVRVVNLPHDKTIRGLRPNGVLDRQLTLTLTGSKGVIEGIESADFEVVLDASGKEEEWIVKVGKKNLVSHSPEVDLMHSVTGLSQSDMIIRLSRLITDKVPVIVTVPKGEPPEGYQFLDVWPQKLTHVVSGPEEDVRQLQAKGIELQLDLSQLTSDDLDRLEVSKNDEVNFVVPEKWKVVSIPFLHDMKQELNGPEARQLHINFLKQTVLPIEHKIPVHVFYSLDSSSRINPMTNPLLPSEWLVSYNGIMTVKLPLFANHVSRLFLDIVKNHLELMVLVFDKEQKSSFPVITQFIDPKSLEDQYVALVLSTEPRDPHRQQQEHYVRARFRKYLQNFELYKDKQTPFVAKAFVEKNGIRLEMD